MTPAPPEKKRYIVRRGVFGIACTVATAHESYPLPHCILHSPTGFEVGYLGSGPADLAASIIADYLEVPKREMEAEYRGDGHTPRARRALGLYQLFKRDVIAKYELKHGEYFDLSRVGEWIDRAEHPEPPASAAERVA